MSSQASVSTHRPARSLTIDGLKTVASHLIVWHHLASYGPIARTAQQATPTFIDWLYDYGRMAVQVFLVIAGYLSARAIASNAQEAISKPILTLIARRYLRLAPSFAASILLALLCAELVRPWTNDDIVPVPASFGQFVAHLLFLQDLLGFESLSAGAWYVSIDLQLFALTLLLLRCLSAFKHEVVVVLGIAVLTLTSWLWFRRFEALDDWAPYFFGAYGLGILACWSCSESSSVRICSRACIALLALALLHTFQWRFLIALATATVLASADLAPRTALGGWPRIRSAISFFGEISYALFLVHFPLAMLGNALFDQFQFSTGLESLATMLGIWLLSVVAAVLFRRHIELPTAR